MSAYDLSEETLPDGTRVIVVSGEVDMGAAPAFEKRLVDVLAGDDPVLLDLTGVTYMDSTAIGVLISTRKRSGLNRTRFALVVGPGDIRRMIEYTGLENAFPVAETREAARAQIG
jgi:anti-sigma B factor antagonist